MNSTDIPENKPSSDKEKSELMRHVVKIVLSRASQKEVENRRYQPLIKYRRQRLSKYMGKKILVSLEEAHTIYEKLYAESITPESWQTTDIAKRRSIMHELARMYIDKSILESDTLTDSITKMLCPMLDLLNEGFGISDSLSPDHTSGMMTEVCELSEKISNGINIFFRRHKADPEPPNKSPAEPEKEV